MKFVVCGGLLFITVFLAPLWTLGPIPETRPDPALAMLVAIALRLRPAGAGVVGFATGLLTGAVTGRSPGAFMVSRTAVGFAMGYVREIVLGESVWATLTATVCASLAGDVVFYAMSPRVSLGPWAIRSLAGAGMTGVCSVPAHYVVRWAFRRKTLVFPTD